MSIIYPPPTGKDVLQFEYCMNLNKVFVLLVTGSLCIYNYTHHDDNQERYKSLLDAAELQFVDKTQNGILETLQERKSITDSMNHTISQEITCMALCNTEPPSYDEEISQMPGQSANGRTSDAKREPL